MRQTGLAGSHVKNPKEQHVRHYLFGANLIDSPLSIATGSDWMSPRSTASLCTPQ